MTHIDVDTASQEKPKRRCRTLTPISAVSLSLMADAWCEAEQPFFLDLPGSWFFLDPTFQPKKGGGATTGAPGFPEKNTG